MHVHLKNEFTEDKKCHNLMAWLKYTFTLKEFIIYTRTYLPFDKPKHIMNTCRITCQINEPHHKTTCLWDFRPGKAQSAATEAS